MEDGRWIKRGPAHVEMRKDEEGKKERKKEDKGNEQGGEECRPLRSSPHSQTFQSQRVDLPEWFFFLFLAAIGLPTSQKIVIWEKTGKYVKASAA